MRWMFLFLSLMLLLLAAFVPAMHITTGNHAASTPETSPTPPPDAHPPVVALSFPNAGIPSVGLTIGDPSAPVSIVEYGDYQCPFCAKANQEGFRPLLDTYIATGQVRLTYVPMSFLGDESRAAAEAALCANDQGKFWEMHETIFANHHGENQGALSRPRLNAMAENIGLNMDQFNTCLDSGRHEATVAEYMDQARQAGVTSVPTFVINDGEPVGWSGWEAMERAIEAALDGVPAS